MTKLIFIKIKVLLKYCILICLCSLFIKGFTQELSPKFGIKETHHFGAILPHRQIVNEVVEGHTYATELSFYKQTTGKKQWQQVYNYPKVGISALYMDMGNPNELGNAFGIFPFVELPLNKAKINWNLKMGYGIGYITKPFNVETNYKNIVIGSHYNALIHLNMGWDVELGKRFNASAGLSIIHFSNGSFKRPNLGVNIVSLNAGLKYGFGGVEEKSVSEISFKEPSWRKQLMVGFGVKEIPPVEGPKYFANTYSFNLIKQTNSKSTFGIGADLFYNSAIRDLIKNKDIDYEGNSLDYFRAGIVGIYGLEFGNISLLIEMGGYLFTRHKKQGYIYHRVTTRYQINNRLFFNLGLKTHFAVADFIEFGVGFNLNRK